MDKVARAARARDYYWEHKEKLRARRAAWVEVHGEYIKNQRHEYYLKNIEKIKAQRHEHYVQNSVEILAKSKERDQHRPTRQKRYGGGDRGMNVKQTIAAQHRIVEGAIVRGTITDKSPYYGWSVAKYRQRFQLDTDHPISDAIVYTEPEIALRSSAAFGQVA